MAWSTLVLHGTQSDATAYVDAIRDTACRSSRCSSSLLTPTARRLGVMWEEDTCDFSDVTLGVFGCATSCAC